MEDEEYEDVEQCDEIPDDCDADCDYSDSENDTIPGISSDRVPFSREDLINAVNLRRPGYKKEIIELLKQLGFSYLYTMSLNTWIITWISENTLLSKMSTNKNYMTGQSSLYDQVKISAELELELSLVSCCAVDKKNTLFEQSKEVILSAFDVMLSRTVGDDRERILNGKTVLENINKTVDSMPNENISLEKKKKWGLF